MARQKQGIDFSSEASSMRAKVQEWKKTKPTAKTMFNNQMGALGSEIRKKNKAKLDNAIASWKAKDPRNQSSSPILSPKPVTTTKVGEGTVLKNKASEATAFLKAASKVMNEIQVKPKTKIQVEPKTRTAMRDKIRGSARIGFKTRAKGTNIGDFKRKTIK